MKAADETPRSGGPFVSIRGSKELVDWLNRGPAFRRTDITKLIDAALIAYLKAWRFEEAAPRR
jgi:hypothetical protein